MLSSSGSARSKRPNRMIQTMKLRSFTCISAFAALIVSAAASDNPWTIRIGGHFPTFDTPLSVRSGGTFGLGYRFFHDENTSVELESLGTGFDVSDGVATSTFTVGQLNVVFTFGPEDRGAYGGFALGTAQARASDGFTTTLGDQSTIYTLIGGYRVDRHSFFEARLSSGDVPAFRGFDLLYGFKY